MEVQPVNQSVSDVTGHLAAGDADSARQKIRQTVEIVDKCIDISNARVITLQQQVDQSRQQLEQKQRDQGAIIDKKKSLEEKQKELQISVSGKEAQIQETNNNIAFYENKAQEERNRAGSLREERNDQVWWNLLPIAGPFIADSEWNRLNEKAQNADRDAQNFRNQVPPLVAAVNNLKAEIENCRSQISQLSTEESRLQQEIDNLHTEIGQLKSTADVYSQTMVVMKTLKNELDLGKITVQSWAAIGEKAASWIDEHQKFDVEKVMGVQTKKMESFLSEIRSILSSNPTLQAVK